ncbi:MAG: translation initiation factor IF-2 subunit gamma [Candidatus Marsarchaeota archaeon]|nr:translation initiation factor IF-2 subunit gamma [Candidatus Marsarchaeota archaeon]MCL5114962.1 translation initiation factor IF-2 subunit gamma [Candidatus Marsarchaeota archaeon]
MIDIRQSSLNIGTLGHIDHGKTSLTRAITHTWTDRHSESLKRNMTIKLGYADAIIRKCQKCDPPSCYTTDETCRNCAGKAEPLMRISMLDAPGHETLMATALAGSSVIDALLFVIAANEPCPMQQTKEHLMIMNLLGIKDVLIIQSKVDIVGKEGALKHYKQIKEFIKGSSIENAPIIPVMTNQGVNIDAVLEMIAKLPKPERDLSSQPIMYVVRSFDINKPGSNLAKFSGGVVGGVIKKGVLKVGDKIELRPGANFSEPGSKKQSYKNIVTVITDISNGTDKMEEARPGGLIGISTEIDPAFVKADGLVGNLVGHVGSLPEVSTTLMLQYHSIDRKDIPTQRLKENEPLLMEIGTKTVLGYVKTIKKDTVEIELRMPVCAEKKTRAAVLRNISQRWRLTGYGIIE